MAKATSMGCRLCKVPDMKRILVVYYSRSGTTQALASELARQTGAEAIAIREARARAGARGYLRSLVELARGTLPAIESPLVDLSRYDIVLLGTPVWAGRASVPMRRYLNDMKRVLPRTAFFCTYGGRGYETAFADMSERAGKRPIATLAVKQDDMRTGHSQKAIDAFVAAVMQTDAGRDTSVVTAGA